MKLAGRVAGITAEAVRYRDRALAKMVRSESWKKILDRYQWFDAYADSATFRRDLDQEMKVYTDILSQLGMAKGLAK